MKIRMQWKDPDAPICDIEGDLPNKDEFIDNGSYYYDLPEDIQKKLRKIGCGEYLMVEFDLDAMTGMVVKP